MSWLSEELSELLTFLQTIHYRGSDLPVTDPSFTSQTTIDVNDFTCISLPQ